MRSNGRQAGIPTAVDLMERLASERTRFAAAHGERIASEAAELLGAELGAGSCAAGLLAEDLVDLGDEDVAPAITGRPAGALLALIVLGASRRVAWKPGVTPWNLNAQHAAYLRATLDILRRRPRLYRQIVLTVCGRDPAHLEGRAVVERAYCAVMRVYLVEAEKLGAVAPGRTPEQLERPHKMLFDVFLHILERWANGTYMSKVLGQRPDALYGKAVADVWRSELAAESEQLLERGREDLDAFVTLYRPPFSPLTLAELLSAARRLGFLGQTC